jgi:hypothetical protein
MSLLESSGTDEPVCDAMGNAIVAARDVPYADNEIVGHRLSIAAGRTTAAFTVERA